MSDIHSDEAIERLRQKVKAADESLHDVLAIVETVSAQQKDINSMIMKLKESDQKIFKLKARLEESVSTRTMQSKEILMLQDKLKISKEECQKLTYLNHVEKQKASEYEKSLRDLESSKDEITKYIKYKDLKIQHLGSDAVQHEQKIEMLENVLENQKSKLNELRMELENSQRNKGESLWMFERYSALSGSNLTDGNANIADLSDENRPTKLAEQYSELYDNEWTDAFSVLTADGTRLHDDVCHILVKAFCIIYSTTRKEADSDLENLTKAMKLFLKTDELPSEMLKIIKDRRKREPGRYLDKITELYSVDMGTILSSEEQKHVSQFLQKSIHLCWLMAIQDPPMYVDTNLSRMDEEFDTNHFKPYTSTGEFIDFVVWPTMYLFEEDNMLSKGIAQGKKVRRNSQPYENSQTNRDTANNSIKSSTLPSANPVSFVQITKENITSFSTAKHDKSRNEYSLVPQSQKKLGSSVRHQRYFSCKQNAGENMSNRGEGRKDTMSVSRENESASTPGPATTDEANSRPKSYASASHSPTPKPTKTTYKAWTVKSTETTLTLK